MTTLKDIDRILNTAGIKPTGPNETIADRLNRLAEFARNPGASLVALAQLLACEPAGVFDSVCELMRAIGHKTDTLNLINTAIMDTASEMWGKTLPDAVREIGGSRRTLQGHLSDALKDLSVLDAFVTSAGFPPVDDDETLYDRVVRLNDERNEFYTAEKRAYDDAQKAQKRLALISRAMRDNGEPLSVQVKIEAILRGEYDAD